MHLGVASRSHGRWSIPSGETPNLSQRWSSTCSCGKEAPTARSREDRLELADRCSASLPIAGQNHLQEKRKEFDNRFVMLRNWGWLTETGVRRYRPRIETEDSCEIVEVWVLHDEAPLTVIRPVIEVGDRDLRSPVVLVVLLDVPVHLNGAHMVRATEKRRI